jgi:Condensin complex subunit 2
VIVGLQRSYPEDKLAEISTSFCFICLLHLANERGLKLETGDAAPPSAPGVEENGTVGNIWGLKVSRMPLTRLVLDANRATGLPGLECYASSVAETVIAHR